MTKLRGRGGCRELKGKRDGLRSFMSGDDVKAKIAQHHFVRLLQFVRGGEREAETLPSAPSYFCLTSFLLVFFFPSNFVFIVVVIFCVCKLGV